MEKKSNIITDWNYEGELPQCVIQSPVFAMSSTNMIKDDNEDPLYRALSHRNQTNQTKWHRIGQLLTNRLVSDLTVPELQVALISFGVSTEGTRDELIKRLKSVMRTRVGIENINNN